MILPASLVPLLDRPIDLSGRWVGVYGSHGPEVVEIVQEGSRLVARKITGDPHVPAGEVTFRAELQGFGGAGEGQIAELGFKDSRFVPGVLTVRSAEEFEFAWEGVGNVVFHRLPVSA